jgi:Fe(3+) dicitrate transport protein
VSKKDATERLKDVDGIYIYAGKKNEVINIGNIDANLVTNNSRQVFARVAGVSIWENDGSGTQISVGVRGLSPNRSWEFNTRQNGYDMSSDVFGYPEAYYNPPIEAVEKIQIVKGGASLQYGSQFGGLLNYILKRETQNKPFTYQSQNSIGSYGLFSSFNAVGSNTNRWNCYAYQHTRKGNGWRENGQYQVSNSHAYVQYKINANHKISIEYTNMNYQVQQSGGLTDEQFANNHQQSFRKRNWFSTPWNLAAICLDSKLSEKLSFNIKLFGLLAERNSIGFVAPANVNDTVNNAQNDFNNRQVDRDFYKNIGLEWRGLLRYKIFNREQNMAFGTRIYQANTTRKQRGKGDSGSSFTTAIVSNKFPTELDFTTKNLAFFIENQFQITDHFSITPGLRYENINSGIKGRLSISGNTDVAASTNSITRNIVLGGIGLIYKLSTTDFYANFSQAFRPVLFSDLTPSATTDIIDQNLTDASGFNADFGYRGNLSNYLSFDVDLFYIQYDNRIGTIRKFVDDDINKSTYQFRSNLGKSSNKGLEASFDLSISKALKLAERMGNFNVFGSLALIDATYSDFKITSITGVAPSIVLKESNLKGKKVENTPNQIHNIGLTYAKKGFSATLQTRINSAVYTDANNTEAPNAAATTGKIEGYQVSDFSAEYKFLHNYNIKFSVNNFTNTKYATRRSGGYPGPGLLPGEARTFIIGFGIKLL